MTVVSDADHWLFISSNGGLTAGRRDANLALFPYYTDDKIRDMAEVTGSKTLAARAPSWPGLASGNRSRSAATAFIAFAAISTRTSGATN